MTTLHATPYDISATGFYFTSYEEFKEKEAVAVNDYGDKVEEFEIQYIDGDTYELFEAVGVHQGNIGDWFEKFEEMDEEETFKLVYLMQYGGYSDVKDALRVMDDLTLTQQTKIEWAEEFAESTGMLSEVPEELRYYFDFESYARDMEINGFFSHVVIDGVSYIAEGV